MEDFRSNNKKELDFDATTLASEFNEIPSSKRIESDKFVAIDGHGPFTQASALTDELIYGFSQCDPGFVLQSPAMTEYRRQAQAATTDIDRREHRIAQEKWNRLSPSLKTLMEKENPRIVIMTNPPKRNPYCERFIKELGVAIAPLETERETRIRKVWQDLPTNLKTEIGLEQKRLKRFQDGPIQLF